MCETKHLTLSFPSVTHSPLEAALLEAAEIATLNKANVPIIRSKMGKYIVLEGYPEDEADILVHYC